LAPPLTPAPNVSKWQILLQKSVEIFVER
jgi:hypothetical protein